MYLWSTSRWFLRIFYGRGPLILILIKQCSIYITGPKLVSFDTQYLGCTSLNRLFNLKNLPRWFVIEWFSIELNIGLDSRECFKVGLLISIRIECLLHSFSFHVWTSKSIDCNQTTWTAKKNEAMSYMVELYESYLERSPPPYSRRPNFQRG